VSLFVRGCWMVSFFFTPIYMFILIFIVSFGTKKGVLASYSGSWYPIYRISLQQLLNFSVKEGLLGAKLNPSLYLYRFQHTNLTSRFTIYVLASFWCFFFFFGESLLLLTFNFNTLTDLIPSGFFVFTKSHVIFNTFSSSAFVGDAIFFFIVFFTASAVAFLLNLRYSFSYSYSRSTAVIDLLACITVLTFFPYTLSMLLLIALAYPKFSVRTFTN
jgi:hypothetical protein